MNPRIIEEETKTQSLFENLNKFWKIKLKIKMKITTTSWPISIPIANSKAATNVFFDPTRELNALAKPRPCINPKINTIVRTKLDSLRNVFPAVKILNSATQKIVIGINHSEAFKFIML